MRYRLSVIVATAALLSQAPAHGQSLAGKTIVYTAADGGVTGYIFIAASGMVYWSAQCQSCGFGGKDKGYRFRLGRNLSESHGGCQSDTSASLSDNVLNMNSSSSCPSMQTTDAHLIVVSISGGGCTLSHSTRFNSPQTGAVASNDRSQTCRIVAGNQIAR